MCFIFESEPMLFTQNYQNSRCLSKLQLVKVGAFLRHGIVLTRHNDNTAVQCGMSDVILRSGAMIRQIGRKVHVPCINHLSVVRIHQTFLFRWIL